ncbi:hypothetical protein G4D82_00220 [Flavobacterium sp. CYK-4]|uniref:beta strand repeat-containing protein n=1 Tax=Flavobacterium lotistagni TaxID=2709660 RepID=UPI0014079DDE|nr:hypothetical protein [Flavobacterium lotistagni]NHM05632.1 hypothetical protein [Flavobacterium lotistagni]
MRKKIYLLLTLVLLLNAGTPLWAQVGIGTTTPFSQLDIRSSNQATPANTDGILIPKIDAFPATNPGADQQSMLVYLTTATVFSGNAKPIGFYYWDNTSSDWIGITSTANSDHDWYEEGALTAPNAITDDMFHTGNVAIGKNTADYPLDIETSALPTGINNLVNSNTSGTTKNGINNTLNGTSTDTYYGISNNILSSGSGFHYGTFNNIPNSGSGTHCGTYNYLGGTASTLQYGTYNSITANTAGLHSGTSNNFIGNGSGIIIGTENNVTNSGSGAHYGSNTILSGTGTGDQIGANITVNNTGGGNHSGHVVTLSASSPTGTKTGYFSTITNDGNGIGAGYRSILSGNSSAGNSGFSSTISTSGTGNVFGFNNIVTSSTSGTNYGIFSSMTGSGAGLKYGIRNELSGGGNQFGGYNLLTGSGTGIQTGLYNEISNSGGNSHYGVVSSLSGAGTGTKMGLYSIINTTAGGTHYGIYSEALKPGATNFAGYFLGNVGIGTTTGNTYTLPASRGTNNQIMVTNGTGTVSWQNASAIQDHDWYEVGSTLAPDAITDNMFHTGNVAIGKNTANYALDVTSTGRTIHSTSSSGTNAALWGFNTAALGTGTGGYGIAGQTNQSNSDAVRGEQLNPAGQAISGINFGASGTDVGDGIYGQTSQSNGFSIFGYNGNAAGTGTVGAGQNVAAQYLTTGSGGAFTGYNTGVYARTTTAGVSECLYSNNFGNIVRVNYWNGATQYKIFGTGTVSTIAKGLNDEKVTLHCTEAPEIYFEDYGQGQLVNGRVHIEIDPIIAKNITVNEKHPLRVFIQLEDECNGVYVTNKTGNSFDVVELAKGQSNAKFQYRIVGNRADEVLPDGRISKNADTRFERVPDDYETKEAKRIFATSPTKP